MTKRGRKTQPIVLTTGNDPTLWRYASVGDALCENTDLLADLIRPTVNAETLLKKSPSVRRKTEECPRSSAFAPLRLPNVSAR